MSDDMSFDDSHYRDFAKNKLRLALDQWWTVGAKEFPVYIAIDDLVTCLSSALVSVVTGVRTRSTPTPCRCGDVQMRRRARGRVRVPCRHH